MIEFRLAATLVAIICAILFVTLLLFPASYMGIYGVTATDAAAFISRRASPLLLGFAVLMWFARDLRLTPGREAIRLSVIVGFAGIAATGIAEFFIGNASWTILVAAAGELLIAAIFLWGIRK